MALIKPTLQTDAAPPERGARGIVFLAGAIKYWWLRRCGVCGHINGEAATRCAQCGERNYLVELWGGLEHQRYVRWRDDVRRVLIEGGYLTYAPHEAFKGTWAERAQAVNDAAIGAADVMLDLSPPNTWTPGTDAEVEYARRVGTPVLLMPPWDDTRHVLYEVSVAVGMRRYYARRP